MQVSQEIPAAGEEQGCQENLAHTQYWGPCQNLPPFVVSRPEIEKVGKRKGESLGRGSNTEVATLSPFFQRGEEGVIGLVRTLKEG